MLRFRHQIPRSLSIALASIAIALLAFSTYRITLYRSAPELAKAKALVKKQKSEIRSLTSRLQSSESRGLVAEQEARVMRQANQLLRESESNRQAELNRLQTELEFYQRLASTSGSQSGLAIYQLALNATGSERVFQFVLTLTQNLRRSAIISGTVRFDVEGTLEDRLLSLPWSRVTDGNQPEPTFRFKYFQQLEGYLELPERFQPTRVSVTLDVKGQKKPVQRSFDWNELTGPEVDAAASKPEPASEFPR